MRRLAILTAVVALAAACGSDTPTTPTQTVQQGTDVFPPGDALGHLTVNGGVSHDFAIVGSGSVQAQITQLSPEAATIVGFALGTWNGTGCQVSIANDRATTGSIISGQATAAGSFCVRLYDVGQLTGAIDYKISVQYPKTLVTP
jgi:hypothetical protein